MTKKLTVPEAVALMRAANRAHPKPCPEESFEEVIRTFAVPLMEDGLVDDVEPDGSSLEDSGDEQCAMWDTKALGLTWQRDSTSVVRGLPRPFLHANGPPRSASPEGAHKVGRCDMASRSIREMVVTAIEVEGWDGLFNQAGECGCDKDDLFPCGNVSEECTLGMKVDCPPECGEHDWHIQPGLPRHG